MKNIGDFFAFPDIIPTFAASNINNSQMQDARLAFTVQAFFMSVHI